MVVQWPASTRSQSILAKWSTNLDPAAIFRPSHSQSSQKPFVDDALPTWPSVTSALASSVGDAPSKLKKLSLLTSLHSPSKANRHPHRKIRRFIPAAKRSVQIQRSVGWKKEFFQLKPSILNRRYLCCFEPPCTRDLVEIIGCNIVNFATSK